MRGHIQRCWLFTWRTPVESVRTLLPRPLEPVIHGGFAFWNVVVCELTGMRPAPLPAALGMGYWHVAYRLHAKVRTESGETIEGLHFIRSDCDRSIVSLAGNWLTDFRFHRAEIVISENQENVCGRIRSRSANAHFHLLKTTPESCNPGSPFRSVEEAAATLKYKPFALSPDGSGQVRAARVIRNETVWKYRVVQVEQSEWEFLAGRDVALEICYAVEPIDYEWRLAETIRVAS